MDSAAAAPVLGSTPNARNRHREKLEEEIELYYRSLGTAEGEEDAVWAELSGRFLGESWR